MRFAAAALSALVAWRWLGFGLGAVRLRSVPVALRGEARRAVAARAAFNVVWSVAAVYLWAAALRAQPTETFAGFLGAAVMIGLVAGVMLTLMQPNERSPDTLGLCRVLGPPPATPPSAG